MDSIRRSFKSVGMKLSNNGGGKDHDQNHHESQPIFSNHNGDDVVVDVESEIGESDNGVEIRRELNVEFWRGGGGSNNNGQGGVSNGNNGFEFHNNGNKVFSHDDPPSRLIGQFLHKQRASGDLALDMDLEMNELREEEEHCLPTLVESPLVDDDQSQAPLQSSISPKDSPKVSFKDPVIGGHDNIEVVDETSESIRQRRSGAHDESMGFSGGRVGDSGAVLKCSSNSSFKRNSGFLRTKTTKSRLMDPPSMPKEQQERKSGKSGKSGLMRSGFLDRSTDDEEDDPFAEEDLPVEFKKSSLSILTILEWVSLILIIAAFVCSLSIPIITKKTLWKLPLWKWELLVLVLICGRLVSGWGIRFAVFFIERNFLLRKRVLYFVYGVRKAVQNCLWLGLVLIAWHFMFDKKVEREVKNKVLGHVTKTLVCLLVATLLWLVKTLLVKVLASSFHVSTYFDRIQESLFNQYVIETLSGPPYIEIETIREEEERVMIEVQKLQNAGANMPADLRASAFPKSGRVIGSGGLQNSPRVVKSCRFSGAIPKEKDMGLTIDQLHKLNQKNISAWNMKRMMNTIRHGVLSTLDEKIYDSTNNNEEDNESSKQIKNEYEAKCAARKIFNNVSKPGSKYIYLEDLLRFMKEDEAEKTMSMFEGAAENKRVNKSSLKNWVVNVFRERKALALTLDDTKTAVNQLHRMVNAIMFIIVVVISLLILGIATTQLLVFISSQLLLVAFMFGNTLKMIFEAIIFLFVMHPFDVGDRCEVDGVQMIVGEMNILTTVFLRYDNLKIVYPNSVLSTKPISNYYRSPDMGDAIDFCIHISTPAEKIATMRQRITGYIEGNTEHWYPAPLIVVRDVEDLNRLKLSVWPTHKMNHHQMGDRWVRRAALVEEMIKIFRDLDIQYRMLPLDVNVRNLPVSTSTRLPSNWSSCTN
ncbi:hypothetical protein GIB67_028203 [Kingdonia uniflora]|uniref:Mechanosensitive ion channel protein n=1 Tax=Kingdonia uniflora TaxID=39325 RepID=A0A7J7KZA5_9MAGN|nr:hypothetical protein GIB67_028203 [Kingdonia uniflora]